MGKHILILSTSLRSGSNSEALADAFLAGAAEAGHRAEKVSLRGKKLDFCIGCLACQNTGACVLKDDAAPILDKLLHADAVVFATPIYFYEMSGQMKTLLDRSNPLFTAEYAFRAVYLLATAADGEERAMDGAVTGLQGWVDCFEKARLAGVVRACGVTGTGEMAAHPDVLEQARQLGRSI